MAALLNLTMLNGALGDAADDGTVKTLDGYLAITTGFSASATFTPAAASHVAND